MDQNTFIGPYASLQCAFDRNLQTSSWETGYTTAATSNLTLAALACVWSEISWIRYGWLGLRKRKGIFVCQQIMWQTVVDGACMRFGITPACLPCDSDALDTPGETYSIELSGI